MKACSSSCAVRTSSSLVVIHRGYLKTKRFLNDSEAFLQEERDKLAKKRDTTARYLHILTTSPGYGMFDDTQRHKLLICVWLTLAHSQSHPFPPIKPVDFGILQRELWLSPGTSRARSAEGCDEIKHKTFNLGRLTGWIYRSIAPEVRQGLGVGGTKDISPRFP